MISNIYLRGEVSIKDSLTWETVSRKGRRGGGETVGRGEKGRGVACRGGKGRGGTEKNTVAPENIDHCMNDRGENERNLMRTEPANCVYRIS